MSSDSSPPPIHSNSSLADVPLDIYTDSLLPLLSNKDLASLSATNSSFNNLLTGPASEVVWRRKAAEDFNFPTTNSGRRSGWKQLYKRLYSSSTYIWGQNSNGRLPPSIHNLRASLVQGGLPIPTRLLLPSPVVGLEAGGWSFHALTTSGHVISWGTLDGEGFVRGGALSHPGLIIQEPMTLPQSNEIGEVAQLEVGRKHVLMRTKTGQVWEFRCFGRVYQVVDSHQSWGAGLGSTKAVLSVDAGWSHSLVLTSSGVFIWWELPPAELNRLASEAGEASLVDSNKNGVSFTVEVESVRLPDLPLPRGEDDKISQLASGDEFAIALTTKGRLFFLDLSAIPPPGQPLLPAGSTDPDDGPVMSAESRARLDQAFLSGQRKWIHMKKFCEMDEVRQLEVFKSDGNLLPPSGEARITAISASFRSFSAYSVPLSATSRESLVLMGTREWTPETIPEVIPELQSKGVIKVVQGDYHNLALSSNGQIYSWGSYSAGALGLGHPQLLNTPLSAPHPPPAASSASSSIALPPMPPPSIFPGFARSAPAARIPPPPDRVEKPTRIRFTGEPAEKEPVTEEGTERKEGKFVFHVCAAGWHSGCLAVELGEGEKSDVEEVVKKVDGESGGSSSGRRVEEPLGPIRGGRGGAPFFRLGYAGRGMHRGVGMNNPEI